MALGVLVASGCGSEEAPSEPAVLVATTIEISADTFAFSSLGDTATATATVRDQTGGVFDASIAWSVSDAAVATTTNGSVTATGNGSTILTASVAALVDSAVVVVRQALDSLSASPAIATILTTTDTVRLTAVGFDANGNPMDSITATWTSSDTAVAVVSAAGLVTARGPGAVTVTAEAAGMTATSTISVFEALALGSGPLADGVMDVPYADTLTAMGGVGAYRFSLVSGGLPPGLALDSVSGVISGTPTAAGTAMLTAQVLDSLGQSDTASMALSVLPPPVLGPTEYCSDHAPSARPSFQDAVLDSLVRNGLGIGSAVQMTCADLTGLIDLRIDGDGVSSLAGVQNLAGLETLRVYNDTVSDLRYVGDLPALYFANFRYSHVPSVDSLGASANLTALYLDYTGPTALDGIGAMTGLTRLRTTGAGIADLTPLGGHPTLRRIDLSREDVTNVAPLAGLAALDSLLLSRTLVTDLAPLAGSPVRRLVIHDSPIATWTSLSALTSLTELFIEDISLAPADVSTIGGFTGLVALRLEGGGITDPSPLATLTALTFLDLGDNGVTDVSGLGGLTSLEALHLRDNGPIADLTPLANLTNLQELSLAGVQADSLTWIAPLTQLTWLDLAGFDFGLAQGTDISPLSNLTQLEYLRLSESPYLADLSALTGLAALSFVRLDNATALGDLQPLLDNSGFGAGDRLYLPNVPNADCAQVAALRARGVDVLSTACP